jgi:hypothetical protein
MDDLYVHDCDYTIPQQITLCLNNDVDGRVGVDGISGFDSITKCIVYDIVHLMNPFDDIYCDIYSYIEYYVWLIKDTSYAIDMHMLYKACGELLGESKIISFMENGKMGIELVLLWVELVIKSMYLVMVRHYNGSLISGSFDAPGEGVRILITPNEIKDALSTFINIKRYACTGSLLRLWGLEQNFAYVNKYAKTVCENL